MKKENEFKIVFIVIAVFVTIIFIVFIVFVIQDEKKVRFCSKVYPSEIVGLNKQWMTTSGVEVGYVKCCRYYYENHEEQKECKIFEYAWLGW